MNKRIWAVAIALLCVATAPACTHSEDGSVAGVPFVAVDQLSDAPTDVAIGAAQQKLKANPNDSNAQLALAQAYLQKARETADPSLYGKAGQLLDDLEQNTEPNAPVLVAQGSLALAQHRFRDALELGTGAAKLAPGNEGALGVLVDANNELGRYPESLEAGEAMVAARPNLASLSRASYARELRGDPQGAVLAMTQAVTAGGAAGGENLAYVQTLLGNLLVNTGDLTQAAKAYAAADRSFPGFPAAKVGRSRILVAQGLYEEAGDLLHEVVQVQPLAEYAIAEGDAYLAAGMDEESDAAYELVGAIADLYRANGVDVDLELALYDADHNPGDEAVAKARAAEKDRPSIIGHDVLAWNLYRTDQLDEAATEIEAALATGTKDPLIRFHAAAITAAVGDDDAARQHLEIVLGSNPRVSAHLAEEVEALATELGLTMPEPPDCVGCG